MKRIITFAVLCTVIGCFLRANVPVYVVDRTDRSPIIGATVIDRAGILIGVTDGKGHISVKSEANFPITVRYIGYEPLTTAERDTIAMTATSYPLKEVEVTPADRPIKRVVCFAREYCTGVVGQDTLQLYAEYMTLSYIAEGKVKGYSKYDVKPWKRAARRYARIVQSDNDSIFKPKRDDDITILSWYDLLAFIPTGNFNMTENIKNGADSDTIFGKFSPQYIFSLKNDIYSLKENRLSNNKNGEWSPGLFKLFGFTIDIEDLSRNMSFKDNGSGTFSIYDFMSGTSNIHLLARGKWFKKMFHSSEPIGMDAYFEIYPIEITNCTVKEYKEEIKARPKIPFQYPDGLQPLSPVTKSLVEALESQDNS